jgi:hypothetical protein
MYLRQPLGSLLGENDALLNSPGAESADDGNSDWIWEKGREFIKRAEALLEKKEQANAKATPVKVSQEMEEAQASETGTWGVAVMQSLSEKAEGHPRLDDFRRLYWSMCRSLIRALKPLDFPYQAELLNLAKEEVKRCGKDIPDDPAPPAEDRGEQKAFQFGEPL